MIESVLLAMMLVLLAGVAELRQFALPAPTGPYHVGTTIFDLTDASRHEDHVADAAARRKLVVQIWYPAQASKNRAAPVQRWAETRLGTIYTALIGTHSRVDAPVAGSGPLPVLLFGARWGGERTQNTALAEELASHGYVVAAVDHPYNASRVMIGKQGNGRQVIHGVEALEGPLGAGASAADRIAYWNRTLDVWAADERFVLDELALKNSRAGDLLRGRLDTDHAGAFGHSFGGAAALRLLGLDPRVKAAVNLDGWTFGALRDRTSGQAMMVVYEGSSVARRAALQKLAQPGTTEDQLDRADNAAVDASLERWGGKRLYVNGTQHMDFSDQPLLPPLHRGSYTGPIEPRQVDDILRAAVLTFFNASLHGDAKPPMPECTEHFPELTVESHNPAGSAGIP